MLPVHRLAQPLVPESWWPSLPPTECGTHKQPRVWGPALLLTLVVVGLVLAPPVAAQVEETRRALILTELGPISSPGYGEIEQAVFAGLQKSHYKIEFYDESLEVTLFPDEASQHRFREEFIRKYADRKPDVIIAAGPASLKFIVDVRERFIQDTPIVFCGIVEDLLSQINADVHFTGVWGAPQPEKTLNAALRLLPGTKHVVMVGGTGQADTRWEAIAKEDLRNYESKLDFTYLTDLTMPTLLERLKHLPSDTIVFHTAITQDASGEHFIDSIQAVPLVAGTANAPVFVMDDVDLRGGAVGGDLVNWADDGRAAAEMAVRILNGEKPRDIPVVKSKNVYMFDWRALRRWGIKESDLPPGSILLNREPTFWEVYRRYVVTGMFVVLAQALVILGLLWQRAQRRKARTELVRSNAQLRESEERFRLVANTAPVMIWMSGVDKLCTYFNQGWLEFTGRPIEAELGNGWAEGVHPEDLERCLEKYTRAFDQRLPFQIQYRLRRHDGEYRWVFDHAVPRFSGESSFAGYIGSCIDVTDRKSAEEVLSKVSQKLIEAHEEERARLARELHDDINQRLALLAVSLDGIKQDLPRSATEFHRRVEEARSWVEDLASDVQALSHRLHSSKLEILGLVKATTSFCKELSERQGVKIDVHAESVPQDLPKEISLCLFRVLQEALQNAAKHSGVTYFQVSLIGRSSEIELSVHDSGIGFEPAEVLKGRGLGLTSMKERLKLVNGELSFHSHVGAGTTIRAAVPLSSKIATAEQVG